MEINWEPFEDYVNQCTLNYDVVDRFGVADFPVMICEQSENCKVALLIIPSHGDDYLAGDCTTVTKITDVSLYGIVIKANKELAIRGCDMPILVCICRLTTIKGNKPQLRLNKHLVF